MNIRLTSTVIAVCFCTTLVTAQEQVSQPPIEAVKPSTTAENPKAENPSERFLLLLSSGPVIVELTLTIDEKPYREKREALIDRLLKLADKNEDGQPTWEEAFATPRFTMNRIQTANQQQRDRFLQQLDTNKNALVDRDEVGLFLSRFFQGNPFSISGRPLSFYGSQNRALIRSNGRSGSTIGGNANLQNLLDADNDGELSAEEIAQAGSRLKSRDADDNDLLYTSEVSGNTGRTTPYSSPRGSARAQAAFPLGSSLQVGAVHQMLREMYGGNGKILKPEHFRHMKKLGTALDSDNDGTITTAELQLLNQLPSQLHLDVDLSADQRGKGMKVVSSTTTITKESSTPENVSLRLPGVSLKFQAILSKTQRIDYSRSADSIISRYDTDSNGYLDAKELKGQLSQVYSRWDLDGDGLIYRKEIIESYSLAMLPMATQVRATITHQGSPLFQSLDMTGDGRLSLREMKTAADRLQKFDANQDGKITSDEIPTTVSVLLSLGNNYQQAYYRPTQGGRYTPTSRPTPSGPKWFAHMDRNGDGDVTLKEWLGTREAFDKVDTNKDGFIEEKEAIAVGS